MSAPVRYIRDLGHKPAMSVLAHELLATLPRLSDRTVEQLTALYKDPTPDRCDLMVRALAEVETVCRRLASELLTGEQPVV
jgi:hypothetical protein